MPIEQTIDQLTAAAAALLSHEYEVYDPAGSPHSQKVTGTQIVSMAGSNLSGFVQSNMTVVTVSPHGIADAYSSIPNNGAMFGIDTPGTTTCGLQEAFNSFANPTSRDDMMRGTVQLAPGVYNCTSPIIVVSNQIMEMKMVGCGLVNTVILYNNASVDPGHFIRFYSSNCRLTPTPADYLPLSGTNDVSLFLSDFTIASVYDSVSYLLLWGGESRGIIRNVGFTYWPSALINDGQGLVTGAGTPSACPTGLSGLMTGVNSADLIQVENCMFWYLANGIGIMNDHTSLINCNFNFIGLNGSSWPNHPVNTSISGTNTSLLSALNSLGGAVAHAGGLGNLSMWNPTFYKCNICFMEGDNNSANTAHAVIMGGRVETCNYRFASYAVNALYSHPCHVEWYECIGTSNGDVFINYNAGTDTTTLGSPGTPLNLHTAGYLGTANWTAAGVTPTSRNINTTAPMTGGGNLSADLTLSVPSFIASGATHASGLVPDPGASAGTTHFLREDATWQVPYTPTSTSQYRYQAFQLQNNGGTLVTGLATANAVFSGPGTLTAVYLTVPDGTFGSGTIDILKANARVPTASDSMVGLSGVKPYVSSGTYAKITSFTNWSGTTTAADDVIGLNLTSVTSFDYLSAILVWQVT